MIMLDFIYHNYTEKFRIILQFISNHFGDENILLKKNKGLIESRKFGIKNSVVTAYIFHGLGCDFQLNNIWIDVEFDGNKIGFTAWSFFSYCKVKNSQITEPEVAKYLTEKVQKRELIYSGNIYVMKN